MKKVNEKFGSLKKMIYLCKRNQKWRRVLWENIGVIQWVECYIWDVVVAGSNPVTYTIKNFIALRFFNIKNLVFPKICITFANEIQKDNDLMVTLLNVSSFETFFDILEQNI